MNKLDATKKATSLVVGLGVNRIVAGIIKTNVPMTTTPAKALVFAGQIGITLIAGRLVEDEVNRTIDEIAEVFDKNVT